MPRPAYIPFGPFWLTDESYRRILGARKTGFLSYSRRSCRHVRLAWSMDCVSRGWPFAEIEQRRDSAELWVDVWGYTPSCWEFSPQMREQIRDMLVASGIRRPAVSPHTIGASRVPTNRADAIMSNLILIIRDWHADCRRQPAAGRFYA